MHGLTTRFFYILQAVLDVSTVAFLTYNHFNSEILVILRLSPRISLIGFVGILNHKFVPCKFVSIKSGICVIFVKDL